MAFLSQLLFWGFTAVAALSAVVLGSVLLLAGGVWLILTGRLPGIATRPYRQYRQMTETWAATRAARTSETARQVQRAVPRAAAPEVQDVTVKAVRPA